MTTIACTRDAVAGDSLVTDGDTKTYSRKVFKVGTCLVAVAGEWGRCVQFVDWLTQMHECGTVDTTPKMKNVTALLVTPDRQIWVYDGSLEPYRSTAAYEAAGSGAKGALVALDCGVDILDAVRRAAKRDAGSGGRCHVLRMPLSVEGLTEVLGHDREAGTL